MTRREHQRRYFFEPLIGLAGGSLAGRSVLDAGCGDGYWMLQALEAGAERVVGLDADPGAIEAARSRLERAGVEQSRWRLEQAVVPGARLGERFEVALCVGLMERIGKPVELFELLSGAGVELIAIDTEVSGAPSSFFELSIAPGAGGSGVALLPSREAVIELAAQFGYDCVPLAHKMGSDEGLGDYAAGRRVAFLCAAETALDELPWEEPPPVTPWWRALLDPSLRGWQQPQ